MANWSTLKAAIASVIRYNNNREITGNKLQQVLDVIVSSIGENATFAGVAYPYTSPGLPDGKVFYIASEVGEYPNFGLSVDEGVEIFVNDGSSSSGWKKLSTDISSFYTDKVKSNFGIIIDREENAVVVDGTTVTFNGLFDMYHSTEFFRAGYNIEVPQTLTLPGTGTLEIYLDVTDKTFKYTSNQQDVKNKGIVVGICVGGNITIFTLGMLRTILENDKITKNLNDFISLVHGNINPSSLQSNGNITSNYISVKSGDSVEISTFAYNKEVDYVFNVYDSNYGFIDGWTIPGGTRTIIAPASSAYMTLSVKVDSTQEQYLKINGEYVFRFAAGNSGSSSPNGSTSNVPEFVYENGKETFQRLAEWKSSSDDTYLLAQVTDVHSGGNKKYQVVGWLNELNNLFGFNVLGNFGDIGLDTADTTNDKDAVYELVVNTKKLMSTTSPWIFLRGNHDIIGSSGVVSESAYSEIFNKASRRAAGGNRINLSGNGSYGYIDDESTKTRLIFINTSDSLSAGYGIGTTQLNWLVNTLKSTEDDYKVIVASHLCLDKIGRWNSYPGDAASDEFETARMIFKDFVSRSSGSNPINMVLWNFSGVKAKLVCVISGDSHFNNYIKRDGVNYIVRQGYGAIDLSDIPTGGSVDSFSWDEICNFDVLAARNDGTAKIFRIGVGGASRDLEFSY